MKINNEDKVAAIPPADYKGTIGAWVRELRHRKLFRPGYGKHHSEVMLSVDEYLLVTTAAELRSKEEANGLFDKKLL